MMPRKSSALVASRTTEWLTPNRSTICCSVKQRVARLESLVDDVLAELGRQLLAQPPAAESWTWGQRPWLFHLDGSGRR